MMMARIAIGVVIGLLGYAYMSIRPPAPRICGSPGGPPVTSPRVKLSDGRHLAYKEKGVSKEEAKYKIIVCHSIGESKDSYLPVSQELINELHIYILSFDRAGYGESDPKPSRSMKSEALDIQELADSLHLGPKFYLIGISMGAYPVYSCLKYLPHRVSGAALVAPVANYWWKCLPSKLSKQALGKLLFQDRLALRVAHYTPWLLNWWITQKWFPTISGFQGKLDFYSRTDLEILKLSSGIPKEEQDHPPMEKEDQGYFDSGCFRHMTGNKKYLKDFKEIDGGYVAFGGGSDGAKITGENTATWYARVFPPGHDRGLWKLGIRACGYG